MMDKYQYKFHVEESLFKIQEYIINNPNKCVDDKLFTPSNKQDIACNVSAHRMSSSAGFTLIELVVTIVIIGILSALGGMFISQQVGGYVDLERRTELVDQAETSLRRMQRDVRAALPNSVRTFDDGKGIELLHVVDGGRYRDSAGATGDDILDFTKADSSFEVLGGLQHSDEVESGFRVVVYNLTADESDDIANAYSDDNAGIINDGGIIDDDPTNIINLDPAKEFPLSSPYQRFFIVDEAVSYRIVDTELRRYSGYTIDNTPGPDIGEFGDLVAEHLVSADSSFSYESGNASRSGLVTIQLALEDTVRAEGERITLLHQVHVDNAP
jgi:MSHA biogenesis protein MshO